jgi:hypothetical protein
VLFGNSFRNKHFTCSLNILRYWQDAPVYTVQYNLLRVESVIMADATASFKDVPELFEVGIDLASHGRKGLMSFRSNLERP